MEWSRHPGFVSGPGRPRAGAHDLSPALRVLSPECTHMHTLWEAYLPCRTQDAHCLLLQGGCLRLPPAGGKRFPSCPHPTPKPSWTPTLSQPRALGVGVGPESEQTPHGPQAAPSFHPAGVVRRDREGRPRALSAELLCDRIKRLASLSLESLLQQLTKGIHHGVCWGA